MGNKSTQNYNASLKSCRVTAHDSGLCLRGTIDEINCLMVIDTGSDVTIVNSNLFDNTSYKNNYNPLKILTASREEFNYKFIRNAKFKISNLTFDLEVVFADLEEDCLLGKDFLFKLGLLKDFETVIKSKFDSSENLITSRLIISLPEFLLDLFKNSSINLSENQKKQFENFLIKNQNVFSKNSTDIGLCKLIKHKIDVRDSRPIKQAPRRIPVHYRSKVYEMLEDMKKQKVIEPSCGPWASPIVLIPKSDGSLRFCIDYRKLNEVTKKDSIPLPLIEDIFDAVAGSSWFSVIDLKSGYWQVELDPDDKEKTAFCIGSELWQFRVLPFGLCNAPATFIRLMNLIFHDFSSKFCLVYLDDIIIFSNSFEDHLHHLSIVFSKLLEVGLKVNFKKCNLFQFEVLYLGHLISKDGIRSSPDKISSIIDWKIPENKKDLRSFLGLCSYYRKFVKDFATIAKPLHRLTEENITFIWNDISQSSFEKLKSILTSAPILAFPSPDLPFILDTDASNVGIGAVLSQSHTVIKSNIETKIEKVNAYFSKCLNKAERNYCVTRRELLAVVVSVEHFRHYLLGREFIIRTDHASLKWLINFKNPEDQLARWLEILFQYNFKIMHRPGQNHGNADALSRRPCSCGYCNKLNKKSEDSETKFVFRTIINSNDDFDWFKCQNEDPVIKILLQFKQKNSLPDWSSVSHLESSFKIYLLHWDSLLIKDNLLQRRWESPDGSKIIWQIVVPSKKISDILSEAHNSPSGGHFGINKTLSKIRERFYWATCKFDVEIWCKKCKICFSKRGPQKRSKAELQVYNVGSPFERIALDILGPFSKTSSGNRFLLVVTDYFTRWPEAIPLPNHQAISVAEALVTHIISRYGLPIEIHSDQGRDFESSVFKGVMSLLDIKKTRTTSLHPQSNGLVERLNRTILQYLSKFISKNQKDWDKWIPLFLLAYRSSKHETTEFSPAMLMLGRELKLPLDLLRGIPPESDLVENLSIPHFVDQLRVKLNCVHNDVRNNLLMKSDKMKLNFDSKAHMLTFKTGDKVWLYFPHRVRGKSPKLQCDWEGPYIIRSKLNDVVYRIQKIPNGKLKVVHMNRLAHYND